MDGKSSKHNGLCWLVGDSVYLVGLEEEEKRGVMVHVRKLTCHYCPRTGHGFCCLGTCHEIEVG